MKSKAIANVVSCYYSMRILQFVTSVVLFQVSGAFTGWLVHWVVIKATLYLLSIPSSVPFLEVLAYAGYPFLYACLGLLTSSLGKLPRSMK